MPSPLPDHRRPLSARLVLVGASGRCRLRRLPPSRLPSSTTRMSWSWRLTRRRLTPPPASPRRHLLLSSRRSQQRRQRGRELRLRLKRPRRPPNRASARRRRRPLLLPRTIPLRMSRLATITRNFIRRQKPLPGLARRLRLSRRLLRRPNLERRARPPLMPRLLRRPSRPRQRAPTPPKRTKTRMSLPSSRLSRNVRPAGRASLRRRLRRRQLRSRPRPKKRLLPSPPPRRSRLGRVRAKQRRRSTTTTRIWARRSAHWHCLPIRDPHQACEC
jgi:hypothetical protein